MSQDKELQGVTVPPANGERCEVEIPDSLDLADRARIALNGLSGVLNPEHDYEMYFRAYFRARPPHMFHDSTGLPTNNPKFAESFPMMRVMSGSDQNLQAEEEMMRVMVSRIGEDGLYYVPSKGRPWHEGVGHVYPVTNEDFANVMGNARLMLAMMAWYQRDHNSAWKIRIGKIAEAFAKIAIYKDDYAYFPDSMVGEAFSYPRSGWKVTQEPRSEVWGAEGSVFVYHGANIRALARWYAMSGDSNALELARKLTNFVLQPKFWGSDAKLVDILHRENYTIRCFDGAERGQFKGHFHGHCIVLRGLLEYAVATNSQGLKEFVRDSYEFARTGGIPSIGFVTNTHTCEGCSIGDMVALGIKLSDAGVGEYWEDVDQYVRNHLVEQQFVSDELLEEVSQTGPKHINTHSGETTDRVIERSIGTYGGISTPTSLVESTGEPGAWCMQCCTGNATQGLYYAWESILRHKDGVTQINLLLNRASPWLNVNSYLPYEGKVVLENKLSEKVFVRIPRWVNKKVVECSVNRKETPSLWFGNYLIFEKLSEKDVITIEFPMVERTEKYTWCDREYSCFFKGNTLLDISPREDSPGGYPLYQREAYRQKKAPMKKVTRYISPVIIEP